MKVKFLLLFAFVLILLAMQVSAQSNQPPVCDWRGYITVDLSLANSNYVITSYTNGSSATNGTIFSSGYYIVPVPGNNGDNITFRVSGVLVNESTQTWSCGGVGYNTLNLSMNATADGTACTYAGGCTGGYCVHNICRSASTYCGDGHCDTGETSSNCAADCGEVETGNGAPGGGEVDEENKTASRRPELIPGVGLRNNTKLQAAIEKVLAKGKLSEQAIENLLRLSNSIKSDISTTKMFEAKEGKSNLSVTMKYTGTKKIKSFIVWDKLPKAFASSSDDITVTASGASIEVVESDPEYIFFYSELTPQQEITITYIVDGEVDASIIDDTSTAVYAESLEEVAPEQICTPSALRCTGDNLEECSSAGDVWTVKEVCTYGCENNACKSKPVTEAIDYTWVWVIIVMIIIVIGLVLYYFVYYEKKPYSFKFKPSTF